MNKLFGICFIVSMVVNFLWWLPFSDAAGTYGLCFCNPKWIYKHTKTNWFGTTCLAILANVAFGPAAVIYWFYKLCTVGRR